MSTNKILILHFCLDDSKCFQSGLHMADHVPPSEPPSIQETNAQRAVKHKAGPNTPVLTPCSRTISPTSQDSNSTEVPTSSVLPTSPHSPMWSRSYGCFSASSDLRALALGAPSPSASFCRILRRYHLLQEAFP